jgi:hypothetical protein
MSLSKDRWELILVDNASQKTLEDEWNLTWHLLNTRAGNWSKNTATPA